MNGHVVELPLGTVEALPTNSARVGPLPSVGVQVELQKSLVIELSSAVLALKHTLVLMVLPLMELQLSLARKGLPTVLVLAHEVGLL